MAALQSKPKVKSHDKLKSKIENREKSADMKGKEKGDKPKLLSKTPEK